MNKKNLCFPVGMLFWGCAVFCISSCRTLSGKGKTSEPFSFFVLGDWGRKGNSSQAAVAREMIGLSHQQKPALVLTVGDNFYENGVSSIADPHWQESYEKVYNELTKNTAWYAALGNHDYSGDVTAQMRYHSVNKNWNMPASYYSFVTKTGDGQKVRFVVLDTDPYITEYYTDVRYKDKMRLQDTAAQTRWLENTLSGAKENWKIVLGHHPVYRVNAKPGESSVLKNTLQPLFDKYGVQAYICGHDHLSQYSRPAESRTAYIISGGGSNTVSTSPKEPFTLFSANTPAFTVCNITGNNLAFRFVDSSGAVMYSNVITRR